MEFTEKLKELIKNGATVADVASAFGLDMSFGVVHVHVQHDHVLILHDVDDGRDGLQHNRSEGPSLRSYFRRHKPAVWAQGKE